MKREKKESSWREKEKWPKGETGLQLGWWRWGGVVERWRATWRQIARHITFCILSTNIRDDLM